VAVQYRNASGQGGSVWISPDSGSTWQEDKDIPPANWLSVSMAADGSLFIATQDNSSAGMYIGSFQELPPIGVMVAAAAATGVAAGVGIGE